MSTLFGRNAATLFCRKTSEMILAKCLFWCCWIGNVGMFWFTFEIGWNKAECVWSLFGRQINRFPQFCFWLVLSWMSPHARCFSDVINSAMEVMFSSLFISLFLCWLAGLGINYFMAFNETRWDDGEWAKKEKNIGVDWNQGGGSSNFNLSRLLSPGRGKRTTELHSSLFYFQTTTILSLLTWFFIFFI